MNNMYEAYDVIEKVRQRPTMYFGAVSISRLQSFIYGYDLALREHGLEYIKQNAIFPLPFFFFHEYVARYFNYSDSTSGWLNMILEQTCYDEQKGFEIFYELFDKFKKLTTERCEKITLSNKNIMFHNTDKYAPKRGSEPEIEPLFKNPKAIYSVELNDGAGYLYLIKTDASLHIEGIYRTKQQVVNYFSRCFGKLPDWEKVENNVIPLDGELLFDLAVPSIFFEE